MNAQVEATIDILRGELERLFSLDEMTSMSERLLGLDPSRGRRRDREGELRAARSPSGASTATGSTRSSTSSSLSGARSTRACATSRRCSAREELARRQDARAVHDRAEARRERRTRSSTWRSATTGSAPSRCSGARRRATGAPCSASSRRTASSRAVEHRACRGARGGRVRRRVLGQLRVRRRADAGARASRDRAVAHQRAEADPPRDPRAARRAPQGAHRPRRPQARERRRRPRAQRGRASRASSSSTSGPTACASAPPAANGHTGVLAVFGSPKTIAPEHVRGQRGDSRARRLRVRRDDVRAALGQAGVRRRERRRTPSSRTSRGARAPERARAARVGHAGHRRLRPLAARRRTPRSARATRRRSSSARVARPRVDRAARRGGHPDEKVEDLVDVLIAAPDDTEAAARARERDRRRGRRAGRGRGVRDGGRPGGVGARSGDDVARGAEGAALPRRAHLRQPRSKDKERAEKVYEKLVALDPEGRDRRSALDEVRGRLGKYEAIVEMLLERSRPRRPARSAPSARRDRAPLRDRARGHGPGAPRLRARAVRDARSSDEYAREIERLAGANVARWNEVLDAVTEGIEARRCRRPSATRCSAGPAAGTTSELGRAGHGAPRVPADPRDRSGERGGVRRARVDLPPRAAVARARGAPPHARRRRRRPRRGAATCGTEAARALRDASSTTSPRARELYAAVLADDPATRRRATRWRASPSGRATTRPSSQSSSSAPRRGAGREKAEALREARRGLRGPARTISPRPRGASRPCSRSTRRTSSR